LEIIEGRKQLFATTPFVLHNKGKEVAHRIQIQSLALHGHAVTFESIDSIASEGRCEVLPDIHDFSPLSLYNLRPLLEQEWNDRNQVTDELVIPVTITYQDFAKHKFEVTSDLVYLPIEDITYRSHLGEGLREAEPVIKVRNTEFRRLTDDEPTGDKQFRQELLDAKVLDALAERSLWKGSRPIMGSGESLVRAGEMAERLGLAPDLVADSLERLEAQGKVRRFDGTLANPAPYWTVVRRW